MPKITVTDTGEEFDVPTGTILFDGIAECGVELPHGCLSGSCGACRITVVKGAENLTAATLIESNTIEAIKDEYAKKEGVNFLEGKIIRLSCRAKVTGDVDFYPMARKKT